MKHRPNTPRTLLQAKITTVGKRSPMPQISARCRDGSELVNFDSFQHSIIRQYHTARHIVRNTHNIK